MTTVNFFSIPLEVHGALIVSKIKTPDAHSLSQVCKYTHNLIKWVAEQPQEYVTLENERKRTKVGGTIRVFLELKLTDELLTDYPGLFDEANHVKWLLDSLTEMKTNHLNVFGTPLVCNPCKALDGAILSPVKFITFCRADLPLLSEDQVTYDKKELIPLAILFDFQTKTLGVKDLELGANLAIHLGNPTLLQAILFGHQNSAKIPGKDQGDSSGFSHTVSIEDTDGEQNSSPTIESADIQDGGGLGVSLQRALNNPQKSDEEKLKFFRIIASHPNAKDIPAQQIQALLCYAVKGGRCVNGKWCGGNPEIVKAILTLPNAHRLRPDGEESLSVAIAEAVAIDNPEMIEVLSNHADTLESCTIQ